MIHCKYLAGLGFQDPLYQLKAIKLAPLIQFILSFGYVRVILCYIFVSH